MNIHIEIEQLALYGFTYHDHRRISASIQKELATLITEKGLPKGISEKKEISNLHTRSPQIQTMSNPKSIGVRVARSIYSALINNSDKNDNIRM
jgi:hypothetical protein